MNPVNVSAVKRVLREWESQGFLSDENSGVGTIPRIESFGSNTRLAIAFTRKGRVLTTLYAYTTKAIRTADTGRDTNVGGVVFADSTAENNDLAFWSDSAWVADSGISNGVKTALTTLNASVVVATGIEVPGAPGAGVPSDGAPGQFLGVSSDNSTAWQAAAAVIAALGLDDRYPQLSLLGYSANDLAVLPRDAALLAYSARMKRPTNARFARVFWEYNLLPVYGQSLAEGREGWARWVAEDVATRSDTWMIGDSVRCNTSLGPAWTPYGSAILKPLHSSVDADGVIYTPTQVDGFSAGNMTSGENVMVGATRYIARAFEDEKLQARQWVAGSAAAAGQSIEALSPGASPLLYNRLEQLIAAFNTAVPVGQSKGIPAIIWLGGEANYAGAGGSDYTRGGYNNKFKALKDAMNSSVAFYAGTTGRVPVMLTYQTGATWTVDNDQLSIGMAQWDASRERSDIVMVGPTYPVTDVGGHLDANGYRWFGQQIGKVFHKVVTRGEGWEPLSPMWTEVRGKTVYIGFHVPEPPLAFDLPYVVNTATDYTNKGFRVQDASGDITISGVRLLGSCIVAIDLVRAPGSAPVVWYAGSATYSGHGCLRDSDPTIADADFMGSTVPALASAPYRLQNWSIAYYLPVGWSR